MKDDAASLFDKLTTLKTAADLDINASEDNTAAKLKATGDTTNSDLADLMDSADWVTAANTLVTSFAAYVAETTYS